MRYKKQYSLVEAESWGLIPASLPIIDTISSPQTQKVAFEATCEKFLWHDGNSTCLSVLKQKTFSNYDTKYTTITQIMFVPSLKQLTLTDWVLTIHSVKRPILHTWYSQQPYMVVSIIISIFQMKKLKVRKFKLHTHQHAVVKELGDEPRHSLTRHPF